MTFKIRKLSIFLLFSLMTVIAHAQPIGHPRILLSADDLPALRETVQANPMLKKMNDYIIGIADETLNCEPNERLMKGKRLLDVSVDNMVRIFYSSYAYCLTGRKTYAKRAIEEMLKTSSFSDWNPSHFLDVSEMTFALALGYDWCYNLMDEKTRKIIRRAIIEKGLEPGLKPNYVDHWLNSKSNWNQVCNAGMFFGALAIVDDAPQYLPQMLERAVKTIENPMSAYDPDGAYPEGPGYWNYGTSYNVLLLEEIERIYKNTFGLAEKFPAFWNTVNYEMAMMTPTLETFCFSDQGFNAQLSLVPFYFYNKTGNLSYLYMTSRILAERKIDLAGCRHRRLLPAAVVLGSRRHFDSRDIPKPKALAYIGGGKTPVVSFRSNWDSHNALYVGMKLGTPHVSHGHMDIGNFYIEADSCRWASELGGERYSVLERAGVDLWNLDEGSQRWTLLRTGAIGHNIPMFNGEPQNVEARADFIDYSINDGNWMYAVADLSDMYTPKINCVKRAISMINKEYVVVQDHIITGADATTFRWAMCTAAKSVEFSGGNKLVLKNNGKKFYVTVNATLEIELKKWNAIPPTPHEAPNPGNQFVGFNVILEPNTTYDITVYLMPAKEQSQLKPPYTFK